MQNRLKETAMKIFDYLDESQANYSVSEHEPAYSAQVMAAEEHERGQFVAKPVIIKSEGNYIMCVLAAPHKVVFDKLRDYLGTQDVKMASEEETRQLFPDCEEGAEPPFGHLYNIRTIMDQALTCDDHIIFQAGSHDRAIHMRMEDYLALAQPEIVDIAYRPDRED
jgi:Ala-tRNA(Pro) deacylase